MRLPTIDDHENYGDDDDEERGGGEGGGGEECLEGIRLTLAQLSSSENSCTRSESPNSSQTYFVVAQTEHYST